jgi:hypothetical protein
LKACSVHMAHGQGRGNHGVQRDTRVGPWEPGLHLEAEVRVHCWGSGEPRGETEAWSQPR